MKPVQLMPPSTSVAAVQLDAKPNYGLIGGIAVMVLALVGVGGYFAMARVDSVKSETAKFAKDTTAAQAEAAKNRAEIQSLGQPVINRDIQIAQGAEQILVAAYGERRQFELMAQELHAVMLDDRGKSIGWYDSITATSAAVEGGSKAPVEIVGFLPSAEMATAFDERLDGTRTLSNANLIAISKSVMVDRKSRTKREYWKVTITADLAAVDGVNGADTSSLVGNGGGGGSVQLATEAAPERPAVKRPKPKPAAPRNPFEVAASVAGGGA